MDPEKSTPHAVMKIVSWLGGKHWYIGTIQFIRLEEALAYCERCGLEYEFVTDPRLYHKHEGD